MKTVNKIISAVALTIGMIGAVNAGDRAVCDETWDKSRS